MISEEAQAVHAGDQAIARITDKLDGYRDQAAAALPVLGYERTVAATLEFLLEAVEQVPDAVAALAAVAIVRQARDSKDEKRPGAVA
jgi:hypothetical protein